ncbi:uncharacterized protein LOC144781883 [Lissotriton helveticus]
MSDQVPPTFSDLVIYFSEEEWALLDVHQKELYRSTMKENYDTLVSLGMTPLKSEIISLVEKKDFPVWDLQDSTFTVQTKGTETYSSFDNTAYSCSIEVGKKETPSFTDPWESIEPVKIKNVTPKPCSKIFRDSENVLSQATTEENKDLPRWKLQDGDRIEGEKPPRTFQDCSLQGSNTEETVTRLGDNTDILETIQMEEIQTPSVWDVRDSTELVKVSWEVQCARALKNVPDPPQTDEGKEPCFKYIPSFSGQRTIEQWEELFAWHLQNSSVKGKPKPVNGPLYKECLVPSDQGNIVEQAAATPCDIEDSIVEVVIAQWENQPTSGLQGCIVGVENRELAEPFLQNPQDTLDRVIMEGKKTSKEVVVHSDQNNNIDGEQSCVLEFHKPTVKCQETKKPSAKIVGDTMCPVVIKKEEQSVKVTKHYLDQIKSKESKESSFRDYQRLVGHIKIERNEELYASEYEDHSVEVAIEEGDDVIACDLQGLPMILIRNDEELSVGAECIVSSSSGEKPKDKIIIGKSTKELTPSYVALGKIKQEPLPLIKQELGELAFDSQEHTTDYEKHLDKPRNSTGRASLQTEAKIYQCTICSKSFTRKYTLTMHMKSHKKRRRHTCSTCKRTFKKYSHLVTHQRSHKQKKQDTQSAVENTFTNMGRIEDQKLTEERSVETVNPGETLPASFESEHHFCDPPPILPSSDKYLAPKPHVCTECGKTYSRKSNLTAHMEIHAGLDPNKCGVCGRWFSLEANLLKHKLAHAEIFKCGECGDTFSWKTQLTSHQRMHFREKLNICKECGKGFPTPYALGKHQLSHAGENPYLCNLCGESFSDTSSFLRHHKSHNHLKSYSCQNCSKPFTNHSSCLEHEKKCWTDNVHLVLNVESVSAAV